MIFRVFFLFIYFGNVQDTDRPQPLLPFTQLDKTLMKNTQLLENFSIIGDTVNYQLLKLSTSVNATEPPIPIHVICLPPSPQSYLHTINIHPYQNEQ